MTNLQAEMNEKWRRLDEQRAAREAALRQTQTQTVAQQHHGIAGKVVMGALVLSPTLRKGTLIVAAVIAFVGLVVGVIGAGAGNDGGGSGLALMVVAGFLAVGGYCCYRGEAVGRGRAGCGGAFRWP
jgi:predicted histidine transporter YuiF (NhaC family)